MLLTFDGGHEDLDDLPVAVRVLALQPCIRSEVGLGVTSAGSSSLLRSKFQAFVTGYPPSTRALLRRAAAGVSKHLLLAPEGLCSFISSHARLTCRGAAAVKTPVRCAALPCLPACVPACINSQSTLNQVSIKSQSSLNQLSINSQSTLTFPHPSHPHTSADTTGPKRLCSSSSSASSRGIPCPHTRPSISLI